MFPNIYYSQHQMNKQPWVNISNLSYNSNLFCHMKSMLNDCDLTATIFFLIEILLKKTLSVDKEIF